MEPLNRSYERKRISTMCFSLVLLLLITFMASYVMYTLVHWRVPSFFEDPEAASWLSAMAQYLFATPLCAVMISLVPRDPMEKYSLHIRDIGLSFLVCCFFLFVGKLAGFVVNTGLGNLLGAKPGNLYESIFPETSLLFAVVTAVILAPLTEEWIFRRMMIDRLNRLGDRCAILFSALIFGLSHGNFDQFFYTFGVGLVFGYLYVRTGKIRYTIFLHMLINLLFGVLPTYLPEINVSVNGAVFPLTTILILLAELILAAAGFVALIRNRKRIRLLRGWVELPHPRWAGIAYFNPGFGIYLLICAGMFVLTLTGVLFV